jgi:hypothetical protein
LLYVCNDCAPSQPVFVFSMMNLDVPVLGLNLRKFNPCFLALSFVIMISKILFSFLDTVKKLLKF